MGQPGMRVTVDAAMRARDVSRPWSDDDAADRPRAADAVPSAPVRAPWQVPATGPDGADHARDADGADRRADGADRARDADGDSRDGDGRRRDDTAQRERRGKADRRRLGKRHARARR